MNPRHALAGSDDNESGGRVCLIVNRGVTFCKMPGPGRKLMTGLNEMKEMGQLLGPVIFLSLVEFRPRQPVRLEGAVRTRVRDFEAGPNGKRYKTSAAAEKACQAHI